MPEEKKPVVSLKSLMTPSKTVSIEFPRFKGVTIVTVLGALNPFLSNALTRGVIRPKDLNSKLIDP